MDDQKYERLNDLGLLMSEYHAGNYDISNCEILKSNDLELKVLSKPNVFESYKTIAQMLYIALGKDWEKEIGYGKYYDCSNLSDSEILERLKPIVKECVIHNYNPTVLEAIQFTFEINGVSLTSTHQIVRSRFMGYSQMSARACDVRGNSFVMPDTMDKDIILRSQVSDHYENSMKLYEFLLNSGIPYQDARFVLPQGLSTRIIMTTNYRAMQDFYRQRACRNVQWEIRNVARLIKSVVGLWDFIFGEGLRIPCGEGCDINKCSYSSNMFPTCGESNSDETAIFPKSMNPNFKDKKI